MFKIFYSFRLQCFMQIPKPNNEYDLTDRICANDGKAWNYRHVPPFPYTLNRIFMSCRLTTNRTKTQKSRGAWDVVCENRVHLWVWLELSHENIQP